MRDNGLDVGSINLVAGYEALQIKWLIIKHVAAVLIWPLMGVFYLIFGQDFGMPMVIFLLSVAVVCGAILVYRVIAGACEFISIMREDARNARQARANPVRLRIELRF